MSLVLDHNSVAEYRRFLGTKTQVGGDSGFDPVWMPEFLYPFQASLCSWAIRKGRGAIFADCGLGKTTMQLVWAENVVRKTNRPVLLLTPLAVSAQTVQEAEKFGIDAVKSRDGKLNGSRIVVTNYERLHYFAPDDFAGVVCDESSVLKNFEGVRKAAITQFMRKIEYRLLCTATAAPNDFVELGTSSEALGQLGHMDMLSRFFKNDGGTLHILGTKYADFFKAKWVFKAHAERDFWRWVCSWARACRKPSDLGCDDDGFILPSLVTQEHEVEAKQLASGMLFDMPAATLKEQRDESRRTIRERCEKVAELVQSTDSSVAWCQLNEEGDLLEKLIPDAVQISGSDSDDAKEEAFLAFAAKQIRVLVTKPKIGAFGLNWQHCAHQTYFPSHSFEQWYQGIRRSWRFGQQRPVRVDLVTTPGSAGVLANLLRKSEQAEQMFSQLVGLMNDSLNIERIKDLPYQPELPSWL